jgi:hypothetical protein
MSWPEAIASPLAQVRFAPGLRVSVTPGATIRSPCKVTLPESVVSVNSSPSRPAEVSVASLL